MASASSLDNKLSFSSKANWVLLSFLICFLVAATAGCDQPEKDTKKTSSTPPPNPIDDLTRSAWEHYHIHGVDIFSQPVECISSAKQTITQLIQEPDEALLDTARSYIKSCKDIYTVTTFFLAANQPTQDKLNELHQRINTPLEMPGFIDSVQDYPFSGIVNDASMPLTKSELLRQHGLTDPSDVSLGFSVLDFLLWGETIYNEELEPRSLASFISATRWQPKEIELGLNELEISEHPNNRRRKYLELAILILESDLNQLATAWNKNTLPPENKTFADSLKSGVITQMTSAANSVDIEIILPLFVDIPVDEQNLAATTLSQWLSITEHDSFKTLLDEEAPLPAKQKALLSIFSPDPEKG